MRSNFTLLFMELLLPAEYRELFKIENLIEKEDSWELLAVEKNSNIPEELAGKASVLNGYCKDLEIIDFPFRGKVMYITFRRRKWKESGAEKSYRNSYNFHREGMKTTEEFGDFLKGLTREEYLEFFRAFPSIQHLQEKDF